MKVAEAHSAFLLHGTAGVIRRGDPIAQFGLESLSGPAVILLRRPPSQLNRR
jgi:hypothetical protein